MCSVSFFSGTSYSGNGKAYNGQQGQADLGTQYYKANEKDDLKNDIQSVQTDGNGWVIVFDELNYQGNSLLIPNNSTITDLEAYPRGDGGDWKKQIQSFLMYDAQPGFWNFNPPMPQINEAAFSKLFPDSYEDDKLAGAAIAYNIEDSVYRIYMPTFSWRDINSTCYYVHLDHENSAATDDHAEFYAVFDNNGNLTDIQNFNWSEGGAFNITSNAVDAIEDIVSLTGDLLDVVTDGVSTEVADVFNDVFSVGCKIFNFACGQIYKYTDNGGVFYFLPVIIHIINRLTCSVNAGTVD
ncbi:hypothetical protein FHS57_005375 [Runella defluvii]|uniref:Uncharacterized protein n=1 Tax=Runella defluvii TaxID=370973 RepID=A0A7W5ZTM2_9BACT|nr:hypothetical protein [Runella defluvii]MBB3841347.1 hypothetical protein [Runella defluvii]